MPMYDKEKGYKFLFGPVPSRRLGRSLGVDIIPAKICTLNCIYCEVGKTTSCITKRQRFYNPDDIISELKIHYESLKNGLDVITVTGAGEPTLCTDMGYIIDEIKKFSELPVAVLTNSTLFTDQSVQNELMNADIVVPSIDAATQEAFKKVCAPETSLKIDEINRDAGLSDEQRFDALAGVVGDLLDDVMAQQQLGQELWDRLQQAAEERGIDWDEGAASQQATSRGFQTMSQDTGDELNGRFSDIQGKVTDIRGYVMAQTQSIIGLLTSMANIETAMYASVQVNNELLRYAVMTYMEIVEINGNTAAMKVALQGIQEDIAAIKRNTSEL